MEYQLIYQPTAPEYRQSRTEAVKRAVRGVEAIEKFWPQGLPQLDDVLTNSVPLCCQEDIDYRFHLCVIGNRLGMWIYPSWARLGSSRWKDKNAVYSYRIIRRKEAV